MSSDDTPEQSDSLDEPDVIQQPMDKAEAQLAEAAASASQSLVVLAEVQQAASNKSLAAPVDPSTYGMGQSVTIDWTGPIEPLIKKIAGVTHYQFRVLGKEPAAPIVVIAHYRNTPIGEVLRNAGYQCGKRANVVIFPNSRVIELRYQQT